ncbi:MAG TPA: hypothetical protein VKB34_21510 [Povalibacter sp.]|nr:hypothetical protein [Povalibacter sp.]
MGRRFRVAVLALILVFVALSAYCDRHYTAEWKHPLRVAVFPINADGSATTEQYIRALPADEFASVEAFFTSEGARYAVGVEQPVRFTLAQQLPHPPPMIAADAGRLSVTLWSLRMRYWAWRVHSPPGTRIRLFVLYHDPQQSSALPDSLGMQKGLYAIVHAFADRGMEGSNATVMAHELLHTLGATDKYRADDNQPRHPEGFAEPDRQPLYPQSHAELMAGRIPLSANEAVTPDSLRQVVIGPWTAAEIGWGLR